MRPDTHRVDPAIATAAARGNRRWLTRASRRRAGAAGRSCWRSRGGCAPRSVLHERERERVVKEEEEGGVKQVLHAAQRGAACSMPSFAAAPRGASAIWLPPRNALPQPFYLSDLGDVLRLE